MTLDEVFSLYTAGLAVVFILSLLNGAWIIVLALLALFTIFLGVMMVFNWATRGTVPRKHLDAARVRWLLKDLPDLPEEVENWDLEIGRQMLVDRTPNSAGSVKRRVRRS